MSQSDLFPIAERSESDTAHERLRRLAVISELGLLDRLGDPVLTALTRLALSITGASGAAVHVFDEHYQRRIAAAGAPLQDFPEQDSLCRMVILGGTRIISRDATAEQRFAYSSFVQGGAPIRFFASVPLRVGGGVAVGTLCAFDTEPRELTDEQVARLEDIADLARAHLELVKIASDLGRAATVDGLTGAINRVIFEDRLAQALARHRRRAVQVLVAMIDLDRFKLINDTHGHARGDAALRWVATRLQECVRSEDTVGRLGGDEFGLIAELSDADPQPLVAAISRAPEGFDPPFTLSVGAVLANDDDDVQSVLRRADEAMYAAKRRTRS